MSSTITLTGDWLANIGNRSQTNGTGNLGTYATGGIAVSANQVGLGTIQYMTINPAGGYTFEYVASTGKVKAYVTASVTPTGTITATTTAPTITATSTAPTITATGTHSTTTGLSVSGANALASADDATKTGVTGVQAPTITATSTAPTTTATFTGTATTAAAGTEVTTSTNLSGVTFTWTAVGY